MTLCIEGQSLQQGSRNEFYSESHEWVNVGLRQRVACGRTHADGDGDEVDEPEEDVLAVEADREEDAGRDDQRHKQDDHHLLHHL